MTVLTQVPPDVIEPLPRRAISEIVSIGPFPARPHVLGLDLTPPIEGESCGRDASFPASLTAPFGRRRPLGDRAPHAVPWRRWAARERDLEQHGIRDVQRAQQTHPR